MLSNIHSIFFQCSFNILSMFFQHLRVSKKAKAYQKSEFSQEVFRDLKEYVHRMLTSQKTRSLSQVDEPSQRKQTRTGSGAQFAWEEAFSM